MSYRNDVDALEARHAALEAEVATATEQRDVAGRLLDEAKARAKRPILDNIRVATPCTADWNAMTGDERVRACGACNKNVYNISSMTRDEAEALLIEKEGRLCVRYFQRADGTILLADCTIGKQQKRKRRIIAAGAAAMLAGGGVLAYDLTRAGAHEHRDLAIQGAMAPEPLPPTDGYVMGGSASPGVLQEIKGDPAPAPPPPVIGKIHRDPRRR